MHVAKVGHLDQVFNVLAHYGGGVEKCNILDHWYSFFSFETTSYMYGPSAYQKQPQRPKFLREQHSG